jgi:hypothetical protein
MEKVQNYANHVRWYPLVHFVITPLLTINLIYQVVRLVLEPGWDRGVDVVIAAVLILMSLASRLQALKAQDRVIRLEERLRYREVLSPEMAPRASALPTGKMISLRFASDGELPGLVERVLAGELSSGKEIKSAIREWRGDHLRV